MSFAESARNTDADLARSIAKTIATPTDVEFDDDYIRVELERADEIPILKGLGDAFGEDFAEEMTDIGLSREYLRGIQAGIDVTRIFIRAYIDTEEIPSSLPVEFK